ncbi:MAG: ATP synthase F1 subunit gamma [Firmicutes bacterium]|jgi:F-type H+-transporting ATPase subunit gamma|nr:ATP synthase F1 subunit gamma [Bacillota bacterium]
MRSMLNIRRRIRGVQSTQQVTRAMKMIAQSRLRRSQQQALTNRAFTEAVWDAIQEIGSHQVNSRFWHPSQEGKPCYVVIGADKGLSGPYNSNILRSFLDSHQSSQGINVIVGRRLESQLRFRGISVDYYEDSGDMPDLEQAVRLADFVLPLYQQGEVGAVTLVYTKFINILKREVRTVKLLPLDELRQSKARQDLLWEPSEEAVFASLVHHYVTSLIYNGLLEGKASELAARMVAMDNATDNAEQMIKDLTQQYNQARQASITQEISEIVGGAEALR